MKDETTRRGLQRRQFHPNIVVPEKRGALRFGGSDSPATLELEIAVMKINGRHYRTIWLNADGRSVEVIDQSKLPHAFETQTLSSF
jgi:hypothetical protein